MQSPTPPPPPHDQACRGRHPHLVAAVREARFRPGLRVCVYHGAGRRLDPRADLTLTTYALLRLDEDELAAQPWDTLVLDEAQAIKNPDSQVAYDGNLSASSSGAT